MRPSYEACMKACRLAQRSYRAAQSLRRVSPPSFTANLPSTALSFFTCPSAAGPLGAVVAKCAFFGGHLRESTRSATTRISGRARLTLDAGAVSRETGLTCFQG
jgi:hypothetical protein